MTIRKATKSDYIRIVRATQNKHLDYLTANHIATDIALARCYVVEENDKAIATCSLVYDKQHNYHAIKRLAIFRKENKGRHIAEQFISYLLENGGVEKIGCTPWTDNAPMRHILEKMGFSLEYIFAEKWCFYSKKIQKSY